jgi:hypothetical protein
MIQKCLKPARAILAVVLLMIFASPKLYAIDGNNRYFAGCSVRNSGLIARVHSILHQRAI